MKKIFFILVLILIFCKSDASPLRESSIMDNLLQGTLYSISRDEAYFMNMRGEEFPDLYYFMGNNFYQDEQIDKALFNFRKYINENKNEPLSNNGKFWLAKILYEKGEYEKAHIVFDEVLAGSVESEIRILSYIYAGKTCFELRIYWLSVEYFNQVLETDDLDSRLANLSNYWLGISYYLLAEYEDALKAFQAVSEGSEYKQEALYFSGKCYFLLDRYEEGIAILELLSRQSSQNQLASEVDYLVGTSQLELGKYEAAAESFVRALAKDPHFIVAQEEKLEFDPFSEREVNWWIDDCLYLLKWAYFLNGKYDEATQIQNIFEQNFQDSPYFISALLISGDIHFNQHNHPEACEKYRRIVEGYPRDDLVDDALFRLGWCHYTQEEYQSAISSWKRLLSNYPGNLFQEDATILIGEAAYKMGNYGEAIENFQFFVDKFSQSYYVDDALYGIAWSFYNENDFNNAASFFEKLVNRFPESSMVANSYYRGGKCFYRIEDFEKAGDYFQKFLGIKPMSDNADDAQYFLAKSYHVTGDLENARQEYLNLGARYPESTLSPLAQFAVGDIYFAQEEYEKAIESYQKLEKWSEEKLRDDARYQIERCYYNLGEYRSPLAILLNFVKKYPDSPRSPGLLLNIGDYYFVAQNYDLAIYYFRRVIKEFPNKREAYEAYFKLGEIYTELEQMDKAAETYEKILSIGKNPKDLAKAYYWLGEVFLQEKNYGEAISEYLEVVSNFPRSEYAPKALLKVSKIYLQLNRWEEAQSTFEMILHNYPNSKEYGEAMLGISQSLYNEGSLDEAIIQAQKVVNTQGDRLKVEALMIIGKAYFVKEEYEKSFEIYKKIYENFQEYSSKAYNAMYWAGLSLERLGRWDEAAKLYEKIINNPTGMQNYLEATTRLEAIKDKLSQN